MHGARVVWGHPLTQGFRRQRQPPGHRGAPHGTATATASPRSPSQAAERKGRRRAQPPPTLRGPSIVAWRSLSRSKRRARQAVKGPGCSCEGDDEAAGAPNEGGEQVQRVGRPSPSLALSSLGSRSSSAACPRPPIIRFEARTAALPGGADLPPARPTTTPPTRPPPSCTSQAGTACKRGASTGVLTPRAGSRWAVSAAGCPCARTGPPPVAAALLELLAVCRPPPTAWLGGWGRNTTNLSLTRRGW